MQRGFFICLKMKENETTNVVKGEMATPPNLTHKWKPGWQRTQTFVGAIYGGTF